MNNANSTVSDENLRRYVQLEKRFKNKEMTESEFLSELTSQDILFKRINQYSRNPQFKKERIHQVLEAHENKQDTESEDLKIARKPQTSQIIHKESVRILPKLNKDLVDFLHDQSTEEAIPKSRLSRKISMASLVPSYSPVKPDVNSRYLPQDKFSKRIDCYFKADTVDAKMFKSNTKFKIGKLNRGARNSLPGKSIKMGDSIRKNSRKKRYTVCLFSSFLIFVFCHT